MSAAVQPLQEGEVFSLHLFLKKRSTRKLLANATWPHDWFGRLVARFASVLLRCAGRRRHQSRGWGGIEELARQPTDPPRHPQLNVRLRIFCAATSALTVLLVFVMLVGNISFRRATCTHSVMMWVSGRVYFVQSYIPKKLQRLFCAVRCEALSVWISPAACSLKLFFVKCAKLDLFIRL